MNGMITPTRQTIYNHPLSISLQAAVVMEHIQQTNPNPMSNETKKPKLLHCKGIHPITGKQEAFFVNILLKDQDNIEDVQNRINKNGQKIVGFSYQNVIVTKIQNRNFQF